MDVGRSNTLPFRARARDLVSLVDALSRGRSLQQFRSLGISPGTVRGSLTAARALGLLEEKSSRLTTVGTEFAMASGEERRRLIRQQLSAYEPYALVLEAVFIRLPEESLKLDWMERWWNTNSYGGSATNRREASVTFASLIEFAGLGRYVVGRRGHPSRVEWHADARGLLASASATALGEVLSAGRGSDRRRLERPVHSVVGSDTWPRHGENNTVVVSFPEGRHARLSLPPSLHAEDRERLLTLVESMIGVEPDTPD